MQQNFKTMLKVSKVYWDPVKPMFEMLNDMNTLMTG